MQRWTRLGDFALTNDLHETQAMRGPSARALLGLVREESSEAQDLRRFLWELGYFDIQRMDQHQVLTTLEHCLSTGVVAVLPWSRMQEILFTPRSSEGRAEGDTGAGGGAAARATSPASEPPPPRPSRPPPKDEPVAAMARAPATPPPAPPRTLDVSPKDLAEARAQLAKRRDAIAQLGHQPKYTDKELLAMAQHGNVGGERFQVRFMEKAYLQRKDIPTPLSGALGGTLEGMTGKGAKYWSTSFDQLEDADTDQSLLCKKLGIEYDAKKEYVLIVVDTLKAAPLTGVASVSATFDKVGKFAYTERPQNFTKAFTDEVMTPEFQAKYAKHYDEAVTSKFLKDKWSTDTDAFEVYLQTTGTPADEIKTLKQRMEMHKIIGNNQDYVGNGVTKSLIEGSPNQFGAVETLNFERREVNLQELQKAGAIVILDPLTPIPVKAS